MKRCIGDITQRVLTQTLRNLERDGYVARKAYPTSPPTVEYWLTPLGESLLKPMGTLAAWANAHFDEVLSHRERFDAVGESSRTEEKEQSTNNRNGRTAS